MYRFLLRPRWIAGHLLVIVTVVAFVNLGLWQLRRLDERQARNAMITTRLAQPVQPFEAVLSESGGAAGRAQFRRVEVTGTFADTQLLTAPRSYEGQPGHQVLAVLQRDGEQAVLVDRGWIPFDRSSAPPPVPDGTVAITGVARAGETGDIGASEQVARIAPDAIARRLDTGLAPVFVQASDIASQQSTAELRPTPLPEVTEGNHFSYAMQWFIFAAIALIGYPVLLWRTAHRSSVDPGNEPTGARVPDVTGTPV